MKKVIKGITWNHTRGYVSVQATSQRFSELHPDVEFIWEKRSLQEFADAHIGQLVESYDLLVIDHPWSGFANEMGVLKNLNELLSAEYLNNQKINSVGQSFESYNFDGFLCALPIDAATPVATYRADLLTSVPKTIDDVLVLAKDGRVLVPAIPIDSLMNFFMFYNTQGGVINEEGDQAFIKDTAIQALISLKQLTDLCPVSIFDMNPIRVYEELSKGDTYAYCPFAYGYSNYSTAGYSEKLLHTAPLITLHNKRLKSTLGGTGLAISAKTKHLDVVTKYAEFTCSPEVQKTTYAFSGGQAGHRAAWEDENLNRHTNNFYLNTLADLDNSFLRPRFNGYLDFQDEAGVPVQLFLKGQIDAVECVKTLNEMFKKAKGDK